MAETLVAGTLPAVRDDRPPSAAELVQPGSWCELARDSGVALTGPDGLLKALTKM